MISIRPDRRVWLIPNQSCMITAQTFSVEPPQPSGTSRTVQSLLTFPASHCPPADVGIVDVVLSLTPPSGAGRRTSSTFPDVPRTSDGIRCMQAEFRRRKSTHRLFSTNIVLPLSGHDGAQHDCPALPLRSHQARCRLPSCAMSLLSLPDKLLPHIRSHLPLTLLAHLVPSHTCRRFLHLSTESS
ncbi:hypothetical protein CALVIDRAFT_405055 [Calocera viscosa TUFC12733]|uniref:F-box domain-containing protein n=1 Tax=Calocera viscosa (strain TUFC12733) TaxID=1330018 RepID=A0A167PWZ1_CALVF|nr:hypothetical protein CALVIDRAFT_405055 [Calocera viscosa TUFC12733]